MVRTIIAGSTTFQCMEHIVEAPLLEKEEGFVLGKSPEMLLKFEACLEGKQIDNMLEIGVWKGGSVAYFVETLNPKRLVAVEMYSSAPVLDQWIKLRRLQDRVTIHYGVDQADSVRLREIHSETFGSDPLDLVVDDASHELERTRGSFNTLFPLLRTGGIYIIEDWAWAERLRYWPDLIFPHMRDTPPLSVLVNELVVASALGDGLIDKLEINEGFAAVHRGARQVDHSFDIRDYR